MLRVIAIDDEPLALQLITSYIEKTPFLELLGTFDNPVDALSFISDNDIDLIFLDILMPDLMGTTLAKTLGQTSKFIFTTAYEKYALEGFKLHATDYLLKPFSYEEFLKSSLKAYKLIELEKKTPKGENIENEFMFIKTDYKIKRVNFNDILYIEGYNDYVKVYLKNSSAPVLSLNSLKNLESLLPVNQFMRVHRSFIVNLKYVDTVERLRIIFGNVHIPVSDQYKESFQNFISKNNAHNA